MSEKHGARHAWSGDDADDVPVLIAHEIRGPLTVISGYLDILDRPLDESSHAKALAESHRAVKRIEALLDDLMRATCVHDCLAPRELAPVSMSLLAAEAVRTFAHASTHTLDVVCSCSGDVLGDHDRLHQALHNLLDNAIAHTPEGGCVTLRVECDEERVVTCVEDDGPGIPAEHTERVFGRFERLGSDAETRPGTGIGLYIVRAIIEAHGGSVYVEAPPDGPGTRFVIELPAAPGS